MSASIVVQKYGGSSVACPEKIRQVARRVLDTQAAGHSVVVVVSAMADTTDDLLSLAKQVSQAPERRELDMLLTTGERISMALLSMAIREQGGQAISFTGSQAGILTNDRHVDARIIEVRPIRVQDELDRGNVVIVAGYQGMSYKREITTLGRGGSDTTAVALAAALDAEWCEICSDVDGVYTTDPRVVPDAQRIPEMSYDETLEMAENGAKVLNAEAVQFAAERDIAIYARATSGSIPGEDPTLDGTVVRKSTPRPPGSVVGIASLHSIHWLMGKVPNSHAIYRWLCERQIAPLRSQSISGHEGDLISAVIDSENIHDTERLVAELQEYFSEKVNIMTDYGTVSAIGAGLDMSYIDQGCSLLSKLDVAEVCSSPHRITWTLPSDQINTATQILHEAFVPR